MMIIITTKNKIMNKTERIKPFIITVVLLLRSLLLLLLIYIFYYHCH